MKLHHKSVGNGRPLIIVHGLFGSGDNWTTVGRGLADHGYNVFLVDLRNHGRSPHDDGMDYALMAADLEEFMEDHALTDVVLLGHSMGGKTAMRHAQVFPGRVSRLVIVDIAPRAYPPHHQSVFEALNSVRLDEVKSRKEVEQLLSHHLSEKPIVDLLMKNLYWSTPERLAWRFDLKAIENAIHSIGAELPSTPKVDLPVCFIRGGKSDYINATDETVIRGTFTNSHFITIPEAGHWVHADQPADFLHSVLSWLAH